MNFPKRVEAVEQDVVDLKQIIEYYYQNDQRQIPQKQNIYQPPKQPEDYCEWNDYNEKWCYDEKYEEWWRLL